MWREFVVNTSWWTSSVPFELVHVSRIPRVRSSLITVGYFSFVHAHLINPMLCSLNTDQWWGAGIWPGPLLHTKALRLWPGEGLHPTWTHHGQVGSKCYHDPIFCCNFKVIDVRCVLCLHRILWEHILLFLPYHSYKSSFSHQWFLPAVDSLSKPMLASSSCCSSTANCPNWHQATSKSPFFRSIFVLCDSSRAASHCYNSI